MRLCTLLIIRMFSVSKSAGLSTFRTRFLLLLKFLWVDFQNLFFKTELSWDVREQSGAKLNSLIAVTRLVRKQNSFTGEHLPGDPSASNPVSCIAYTDQSQAVAQNFPSYGHCSLLLLAASSDTFGPQLFRKDASTRVITNY